MYYFPKIPKKFELKKNFKFIGENKNIIINNNL